MKYSWFTVFCQFLLYSIVTLTHTHSFSHTTFRMDKKWDPTVHPVSWDRIWICSVLFSAWEIHFKFKVKKRLSFSEELEYLLIPVTKPYNLVCPLSWLVGISTQIWNNHGNYHNSQHWHIWITSFLPWSEFSFSFIAF